jgi:hypothetical protein
MQFLSDALWLEIERLAGSGNPKFAAVAFVTTDDIVEFGTGDLLVTDATDGSIRSGRTDRNVLRRAFDRGATLRSCPGLHAKVIVFDDRAVVGSANISNSSRHDLIEAGLVIDAPECVAEMRAFVQRLAEQSDRIDETFLCRIDEFEIERNGPISKRRMGTSGEAPRPTPELLLEYWEGLRALMLEREGTVRPRKPQPMNWYTFAIGRSGFGLQAYAGPQAKRIGVKLFTQGDRSKVHFDLLLAERTACDAEIGELMNDEELDWAKMLDENVSQVRLWRHSCDLGDRGDWPRQHDWLFENLQVFHRVFAPRIKHLKA